MRDVGATQFFLDTHLPSARKAQSERLEKQRLPSRAIRLTFASMGRTADYSKETCAVAGALSVVGDPWTLLILRDAFSNVRRFDDWQARLGSPLASRAWSHTASWRPGCTPNDRRDGSMC